MSDVREIADAKRDRGGAAARSAKLFYENEKNHLLRRIDFFRDAVAGSGNPALRAQMTERLAKVENDLSQLEAGWQRSSMRSAVERVINSSQESRCPETRIVTVPAAVPTNQLMESNRATGDDDAVFMSGYAAVFGVDSVELLDWNGAFIEQLETGCFSKALQTSDTILCFQSRCKNPNRSRTIHL